MYALSSYAHEHRETKSEKPKSEALNPARGLMVGIGISSLLWVGIAALIFG